MKRLKFSLLVIVVLVTSVAYTSKHLFPVNGNDKTDVSGTMELKPTEVADEPEFFVLKTEHAAYQLNGSKVTSVTSNTLSFEFSKPGRSVIVLQAKAPLIITEQIGLTAKLRPGWDGTLGYSLYALDFEARTIGPGRVVLAVEPVRSGAPQSKAVFDARISRFPDSKAGLRKWQKEWREKLINRLMNGGLPERVPLQAEVVDNEDHPTFTLRRVRYKTQSDRSNTLLLSLPKNVSGRAPLLIALHGHEAPWGEADALAFTQGHIDDFCAYFAERGWAVLQPATMNHTLQHAGWTLQGEWTWDTMVALDYAAAMPEVDGQQVVVVGLSTGGHLAMNMLALDDRVEAGVVGCVLSTWNHYGERMRIPPHCDCGIYGQLGSWLEECDWAALAAPKPVQFQHGRKDAGFCPGADPALLDKSWNTSVMPEEEFALTFAEVERAYKLTNAAENVKLHIHNDVHRVNNEAAYSFLMSVMKKNP